MAPCCAARSGACASCSLACALGGTSMNRWWTALPLAVTAAVPVWTAGSWVVCAIEAASCMLCVLGISQAMTGLVTTGCVIAVIGYAAAVWLAGTGVDVVGP